MISKNFESNDAQCYTMGVNMLFPGW